MKEGCQERIEAERSSFLSSCFLYIEREILVDNTMKIQPSQPASKRSSLVQVCCVLRNKSITQVLATDTALFLVELQSRRKKSLGYKNRFLDDWMNQNSCLCNVIRGYETTFFCWSQLRILLQWNRMKVSRAFCLSEKRKIPLIIVRSFNQWIYRQTKHPIRITLSDWKRNNFNLLFVTFWCLSVNSHQW